MQPIKTWKFTDYTGKTSKIEYYGDTVSFHWSYSLDKKAIIYTPKALLLAPYCLGNHWVFTEMMQFIVNHHDFDKSSFTEKEERHWRFWKYLDCSKLPHLTCRAVPTKYGLDTFLELTPEGVRGGYYVYNSPRCIFFRDYYKHNNQPSEGVQDHQNCSLKTQLLFESSPQILFDLIHYIFIKKT